MIMIIPMQMGDSFCNFPSLQWAVRLLRRIMKSLFQPSDRLWRTARALHSTGSQLCSLSSCNLCLYQCKILTNLRSGVCRRQFQFTWLYCVWNIPSSTCSVKNGTLGSRILTWRRGDERISPTNIVQHACSSSFGVKMLALGPFYIRKNIIYNIYIYTLYIQISIILKTDSMQNCIANGAISV